MSEGVKVSSDSFATDTSREEDSLSDDDDVTLTTKCNFREPDLVKRFHSAVAKLIKIFSDISPQRQYDMKPVLLAENVDNDVLEMLPSLVGSYHVNKMYGDRQQIVYYESVSRYGA